MQKYKSNITSTSGAAIRGVPVLVIAEDGDNATLFLDRAGTVPAPNPLTTGPDGVFYFYAVNGRYSIRTTVDGVTITDDDVVLMMDPEEITVAGPIAEAVAAAQAAATAAEFAVEASGIPELVAAAQNAVVDANNAVSQASTAASNAATSKTGADSARDAAVIAKTAAEAALDSFDDRYLGQKPADPANDNDGGALLVGALYFRTTAPIGMKVWTGTTWDDAYANLSSKFDKTGGEISGNVNLPSLNGGQLAGLRNKIINGAMEIAQRGTTVSLSTPGQFSVDRWIHTWDGTGATRAVFRQEFPSGTGPENIRYFLSLSQSVAGSGGTYNALEQRIEGVGTFAGQTVTLSFYARNNASTPLPKIICRQFFGVTGSATISTTVATNVTVTAGFTRHTYAFTVPSIVGKTISGGGDFLSILILLPINSVFTFDITGVQLEVGSVATPFEHRPYGMELDLARRYTRLYASAKSTSDLSYEMRAAPTQTGSGPYTYTAEL